MKTIYKYNIESNAPTALELPQGARVISAGAQPHGPCVWAEVDTEAPTEKRVFRLYGTGEEMDGVPHAFLSTFQVGTHEGLLVFHVYEQFLPADPLEVPSVPSSDFN